MSKILTKVASQLQRTVQRFSKCKKLFNVLNVLKQILIRAVEEVVPFILHWTRSNRIKKETLIAKPEVVVSNERYKEYAGLSNEELFERIKEERERAKLLDEKTFKLSLSLSLGLSILGVAGSTVSANLSYNLLILFKLALLLSIIYSISGGFISLGALKTLPSFGYGTDFLIQSKKERSYLIHALVSQERMNIIRHIRNEAAYQCLRNAIIILIIALGIYIVNQFIVINNQNITLHSLKSFYY